MDFRWDLSDMFPDVTDKSIKRRMTESSAIAKAFRKRYHNKIKKLSAEGLLECIKDYENYITVAGEIFQYCRLSFSADMNSTDTQELNERAARLESEQEASLSFFHLEISALLKSNPGLVASPALGVYKHALERIQRNTPYRLSEVEEQLIIEKDQFGVDAWAELRSKWLNTRMIRVKVEGKEKDLPYTEANGLRLHNDRSTRESADRSIHSTLGKSGEVFGYALKSICGNWVKTCERRGYPSPLEGSLIANDTEAAIVESLLGSVEKNIDLYRRYLRLKAKLLGLPKLCSYDLLAPLPDEPNKIYGYEEAKNIVAKAYMDFDPEYAGAVKDMFKRNHIDALPRSGKSNGGFCSGWYRGKSAFVLMNYNGKMEDIFTLAHELGHATHDYYAYSRQPKMNATMPMVVAETASIFGELLTTDMLLKDSVTDQQKRAVLSTVLD